MVVVAVAYPESREISKIPSAISVKVVIVASGVTIKTCCISHGRRFFYTVFIKSSNTSVEDNFLKAL